MGSGKSTVGPIVAAKLALPFIDLDAAVEQQAQQSVADIFKCEGEHGFRQREHAALTDLMSGPRAVIALGGGTVTSEPLRRQLLSNGFIVTLSAPLQALVQRVSQDSNRPLLADKSPAVALAEILNARAAAYSECHVTLATDSCTPAEVAERVLSALAQQPIVVPLGTRTYRVEIGTGVRKRIAEHVAQYLKAPVVLITDRNVQMPWAAEVSEILKANAVNCEQIVLEPGEVHKTSFTMQMIWERALNAKVDRNSLVVGVGGGVVGDLSGFTAATLLRGVAVGHVPTTLLAMVDSAVGGKTGFDTAHGKNLIGVFHQPSFVLCDPQTLQTLPDREFRCGLAEAVKSAWLSGETFFTQLEADLSALAKREPEATERLIRGSVQLKARIVTEDERENSGRRMLLNLGHTLGHAIEASANFAGILHGEAVALGMVAACGLAIALGEMSEEQALRLVRVLAALKLPTNLQGHLSSETFAFIVMDKKRRGQHVQFVIPRSVGDNVVMPVVVGDIERLVRQGWKRISDVVTA